ncbi:MAG: [Fe-Fe] hydrogenase large subunit C-terminal domain-containing protein [bacterium]|nr:[Fe-Fe] hydrogenase large subunit C-terminal domain-containing protein [bacterium]
MTGPVYTIENECQDCYKCVRHCPVKAIRIVGGKASVIPEACVACGECVKVCPAHAKKIRNDLARLRQLLDSSTKVYASIAPSFAAYFKGVTIGQLAAALKEIGFAGVSETAHGAEAVSAHVSKLLEECPETPFMVSSACPAAVDMIRKYLPNWAKFISPLPSPVRAHCKLLKEKYGNDIKVVFFGPCAAKKNESDANPDQLALALVFPVLQQLLEEKGVLPEFVQQEAELELGPAEEGRFYSVEGGMNDTIRDGSDKVRFVSVSGLDNLRRLLSGTPPTEKRGRTVFLEALACPGGCVNGPAMNAGASLDALFDTDAISPLRTSVGRCFSHCGGANYAPAAVKALDADETMISAALARVGKYSKADELNCGACGYSSCRDFARALLEGKAEEAMCHNFLRQSFQRTSNALIKYIPAAVVIVDENRGITECNRNFADLVGAGEIFETLGNLNGIPVDDYLADFGDLFTGALAHGSEIEKFNQHLGERIVNISVFSIAKGKFAGAVIQDVTKNEFHREQIAARAREVIRKNVITVQQVARLFGEHIAETEIMLNEIAGTYTAQTQAESHGVMKSGGFN